MMHTGGARLHTERKTTESLPRKAAPFMQILESGWSNKTVPLFGR